MLAPVPVAVAVPSASESPPSTLELAAPAPAPAPVAPAPTAVLVLGDSLSDEAVGGGGFVKFLRARCPGVLFDNRAKGGFMVNQMRRRLENEVLPSAPAYSHAIVFGGVNDLYSDLTANRKLPRIQADLARIYSLLQARHVRVVAVTVTPWGGFTRYHTPARAEATRSLNEWILASPALGRAHTAVDAYPLLSCGDAEQLCPELAAPFKDGLHFGKLGQQRLGEALYQAAFQGCAERAR